ncbi:hypothetical protein GOBAR_AA14464 [Gossypium barbadense]|uniref:AIPP2-like SPOC-like domain-containing protein n=1 Tax=Gossypium barbadense TaxID=3634 RepID=A0A2P5XS59_GOSBA|nr:hypothetical protein GOBAR_AA14464 [Gossypium barbadense]
MEFSDWDSSTFLIQLMFSPTAVSAGFFRIYPVSRVGIRVGSCRRGCFTPNCRVRVTKMRGVFMVPPKTVKRLVRRSLSQKVHTKAESGTCNVCSAPCSSCMHLSISQMGSKKNEFSDETDSVAVATQYSINDDKTNDSLQNTHSEASNLLSVNSSHDSYSENIESKATTRPSDASEDVGIQRNFSNKYDGSKGIEGHDDSSLLASRASGANTAFSYCNKDLDSNNSSRSSVSVCSLGSGKVLSSQKVDLSELPSVKEVDDSKVSLRIQSPYSHSQSDKSTVGGSSEISTKIHLKSEADTDRKALDKADKSLNEDEHDESNELVELPGKLESPLQAASGDESCESVATELDLNVMSLRGKILKMHILIGFPFALGGAVTKKVQVKVCDICGDAGREDLLAICSKCADGAEHTYCMREMLQKVPVGDWLCEECKLAEETESQKQGLDSEGKKAKKLSSTTQNLGKRHAENLEDASASKRQAVEQKMGSPKSLSPSKASALSREGSFKNMDKGKVRPSPQLSLGCHSGNDMLETTCSPASGPRLQSPKGTLLKSNSFNALNSKPKVKLVDEVALQKEKIFRKHASLNSKEEASRVMGKSMSFKSTNSGRLSTGESKFKMLSSKYAYVQDLKGLKQVKEQISLERKNLSKLDRSSSTVSTPKVDQKLTTRTDTISHSSASNSRETKAVRSDGKPSTLSRSTTNLVRNGVENAVISASGVSTTNGGISSEQKLNQVSLKEEPLSSTSWTVERQPSNNNVIISDGLSWSLDLTNQSERMGHTAEYCSVSQASGADESAPRSFKEEINKGNKLKAAIEAAICLRPRICERTSQDPSSVSVKAKNMISVEGTHESQTNVQNQTSIGNMKLLNAHCTDALSVVSSVGNAPPLVAESAVSEMSAIPEHECIWQGAFQVHKMGKPPDFCGGIQAHLSTLASPKVIEVVNTFPLEVPLNEVPRLSTWPTQFHNSGPKEDNIALYFFAKDLESYEKYYKVLLDTMVKNDLALKGNFEGVEFLIFPSNKLPESCQRVLTDCKWLLFFSTLSLVSLEGGIPYHSSGVFSREEEQIVQIPQRVHTFLMQVWYIWRERNLLMSLSQWRSESAACDSSCNVVVTGAVEKICISTERVSDSKVFSFGKTYVGIKAKLEEQDGNIDNKYLSRIATNSIKVHPDMKSTSHLDDGKVPDCRLDTELKPCHQATETNIRSFEVKKEEMQMPVEEDYPSLKDHPTGKQEVVIVGKIDGESVKIRQSRDDGYADVNTYSKRDVSSWQLNHRKRPYLDLTEAVPEMSTESSQRMPWSEVRRVSTDRGSDNKKLKTGFTRIYEYNGARDEGTFSDNTALDRHGLGSGSCVKERCNIACEEKGVPKDMGSGERFFPIGSDRAREIRMEWREELLVKDEDRAGDASPNLELALGAEMRPPNKGILPFFVGTADKSENLDKVTGKEEADDVSASLSLSLSFPFPETEGNAKSVSKTEQFLPESHGVNTSLLLFGGFPNK